MQSTEDNFFPCTGHYGSVILTQVVFIMNVTHFISQSINNLFHVYRKQDGS